MRGGAVQPQGGGGDLGSDETGVLKGLGLDGHARESLAKAATPEAVRKKNLPANFRVGGGLPNLRNIRRKCGPPVLMFETFAKIKTCNAHMCPYIPANEFGNRALARGILQKWLDMPKSEALLKPETPILGHLLA